MERGRAARGRQWKKDHQIQMEHGKKAKTMVRGMKSDSVVEHTLSGWLVERQKCIGHFIYRTHRHEQILKF